MVVITLSIGRSRQSITEPRSTNIGIDEDMLRGLVGILNTIDQSPDAYLGKILGRRAQYSRGRDLDWRIRQWR